MRHRIPWKAPSSVLCAALAHPVGAAQPPELQPETLGPSTLEGRSPERIYVADIAINHIADGRIRVFDATNGRFLGMVSTGFAGNFTFSPKANELYVATTYLSRSWRGDRADVLEVHDATSLGFKYEVLLPPHRAQALNYRGLVATSGNGRFSRSRAHRGFTCDAEAHGTAAAGAIRAVRSPGWPMPARLLPEVER